MKTMIGLLIGLSLIAVAPAQAEPDEAARLRAACRDMASKNKVSLDDRAAYVANCIQERKLYRTKTAKPNQGQIRRTVDPGSKK